MSDKYDFDKVDEHKVSQNAIELFKELEARRDKYKKGNKKVPYIWNNWINDMPFRILRRKTNKK